MVDVTLPELLALPSRVEGERVVVRPYARGDGEAVFEAVSSSRERLSQWLPWPRLHVDARFSEAYARRCAARWMARMMGALRPRDDAEQTVLVATSGDTGSAVGFGGLQTTLQEAGVDGESDALYDQAVAVVLQHKRASISLVQRHLRIGYNRAARLLEQMEKSGVVSAMATNGNRDIIVPRREGD